MKKPFLSLIAISLLFPVFSGFGKSFNLLADTNSIKETCVLDNSRGFGYVGDASGKRIYTKEEYVYKCTTTKTERGACKSDGWVERKESFNLGKIKPGQVVFETEDYSGSMGSALAAIQAYNKINGIWSGWHGICQKGKDDGNWDWLSDPYVLASYAISAYAGTYGASATAASTSATAAADTAAQAAMESASFISDEATEVAKTEAAAVAAKSAAQMTKYAVCSARAGLSTASMISEYKDDGEPCDPVDEMCDEEASSDSEIYTIPEKDYNELLNNNPDAAKYIKVLSGQGSGTVLIKVINPGMDKNANVGDMAAAKEAAEKIKRIMLSIRATLMAIQLSGCLKGNDSGEGDSSKGESPTSAKNLAMMSVGSINPIAGMALSMAMNTFESMQDIDTCGNKDDAKEKGSRHISTYESKNHGMCHFIEDVKSGSAPFSEKTVSRFCCYDDKLTRILVEQSKAQLLKDWQHCADMTVAELQYLKFKACTPEDRTYGIDGVKLSGYATLSQRESAYQFKRKCIDLDELMEYMLNTFGGKDMLLDDRTIKEQLDLMKVE